MYKLAVMATVAFCIGFSMMTPHDLSIQDLAMHDVRSVIRGVCNPLNHAANMIGYRNDVCFPLNNL